jgi:glutamine synthetase
MQNSAIAKELFGEGFVEHFTQTRLWEHRQYAKQRYRLGIEKVF